MGPQSGARTLTTSIEPEVLICTSHLLQRTLGTTCNMVVEKADLEGEVVRTATDGSRTCSNNFMDTWDMEIEVQWMVSGERACSISTTSSTVIADVKVQVQEKSGVPVDEQRIFVGERELLQGECISRTSSPIAENVPRLLLVRNEFDPRVTNLAHFLPAEETFAPIPVGSFQKVRKLADAIHGSVFKYKWVKDGHESNADAVTVKRLQNDQIHKHRSQETNEREIHIGNGQRTDFEDSLSEIGILSHLSHLPDCPLYLLNMLGVFADDRQTWLVTEFCDGGELFSVISSQAIHEVEVRRYTWQLLQAVAFLDAQSIGHRDISLENILLKDGNIRLMDFGMAVQSYSTSGIPLRYYCAVGKDFYRAPECYVPSVAEVSVVAPYNVDGPGSIVAVPTSHYLCEVKLPEGAKPGCACKAEPWGYRVPPADVFASGVCMFILGTQTPPWNRAVLNDSAFKFVHSKGKSGLSELLRNWNRPLLSVEAMELLDGMLQPKSDKRKTVVECLASPWFDPMRAIPIPTHVKDCYRSTKSVGA